MKKALKIIIPVVSVLIVASIGVAIYFFSANNSIKNVEAKISEISKNDAFLQLYHDRIELLDNFGMNEEERANFKNRVGEWHTYLVFIDVENQNVADVTFYKASGKATGENGIWVSTSLDSETMTLESGAKDKVIIQVLVKGEPGITNEDIKTAVVDNYGFVLEYTKTPEAGEPEEQDVKNTKTVKIKK